MTTDLARAPGWHHEHVCVSAVIVGGVAPSALGLDAQDLADPAHRTVWRLAQTLEARGAPIDVPALLDAAAADGADSRLLERVIDGVTSAYHLADDHARQVRSHARARHLRAVAAEMLEAARGEPVGDPDAYVAQWLPRLEEVGQRGSGSALVSPGEAMRGAAHDIAEMIRGHRGGYELGIPVIDHALAGGLAPRRLCVVAAPTGAGKTTLAVQAVRRAGASGRPSLVVSLEMSAAEVIRRSALTDAGLTEARIVGAGERMSRADSAALTRAMSAAERDFARTTFIDRALRPRELVAEIRAWTREIGGCAGLVVIDYLQLLPPTDDRASRERQVAEVVAVAKNEIASACGHATLAISQFNRGAGDTSEPGLHHLRESGAIEQYAETVLLAFRRGDTPAKNNVHPVWIKIAKNRYGVSGTKYEVGFDARRGRFVEAGS